MSDYFKDGNRLICRHQGETVWIEPWGADSLRIRATRNTRIDESLDFALLPQEKEAATIVIEAEYASVENGKIKATIRQGLISFHHKSGRKLLEELWLDGPRNFATLKPGREYLAAPGGVYRIEVMFKASETEKLYGLGQHPNGFLNQKGCVIELAQRNSEVSIPFLLSNQGYGFLWNNPAYGSAELARNRTMWTAQATAGIDYWITAADSPDDILRNYTQATGRAPAFPGFASGFWQCKLRYRNQEELLAVAREYKRRQLPLSVIVIDYFHWPHQGDWRLDPKDWPDPAGMVRELRDMGVELMVSVWPSVEKRSENYRAMSDAGLLSMTERGVEAQMYLLDYITFYDATNPEARRFLWQKLEEHYYRFGIRVYWLDACEPETIPYHFSNIRYHLGSSLEIGSLYPLLHERGICEGLAGAGEKEIISLARSAWAGSQRYGAAVWSGDIASTFESLRNQIKAGLNMAVSGIPWWTTDTGGFHGGNINDPEFRELLIRWFQYSTFCPILRLHGSRSPRTGSGADSTGADNEVWSFGEAAYQILADLLRLRERLRPYIHEQMQLAHERGTPVMRPLFYDFHQDPPCYDIEDQFLFGPDILVAPVTEYLARDRKVYLPAGADWTDAQSGQVFAGGQWISTAAPLEAIPVFIRKGSPVRLFQPAET